MVDTRSSSSSSSAPPSANPTSSSLTINLRSIVPSDPSSSSSRKSGERTIPITRPTSLSSAIHAARAFFPHLKSAPSSSLHLERLFVGADSVKVTDELWAAFAFLPSEKGAVYQVVEGEVEEDVKPKKEEEEEDEPPAKRRRGDAARRSEGAPEPEGKDMAVEKVVVVSLPFGLSDFSFAYSDATTLDDLRRAIHAATGLHALSPRFTFSPLRALSDIDFEDVEPKQSEAVDVPVGAQAAGGNKGDSPGYRVAGFKRSVEQLETFSKAPGYVFTDRRTQQLSARLLTSSILLQADDVDHHQHLYFFPSSSQSVKVNLRFGPDYLVNFDVLQPSSMSHIDNRLSTTWTLAVEPTGLVTGHLGRFASSLPFRHLQPGRKGEHYLSTIRLTPSDSFACAGTFFSDLISDILHQLPIPHLLRQALLADVQTKLAVQDDPPAVMVFRFFRRTELDFLLPLDIEPKPDGVLRLFLVYRVLEKGPIAERSSDDEQSPYRWKTESWRKPEGVNWLEEVGRADFASGDDVSSRVIAWGTVDLDWVARAVAARKYRQITRKQVNGYGWRTPLF